MMDFNEDTFLRHQIPVERNSTVIGILDMDAFEVQIYRKMYPGFDNCPAIVCNSSNRILSVSYEAKLNYGITRKDNKQRAKAKCPHLKVFQKRDEWGKPETKPLRLGSMIVRDAIKLYRSQNFSRAVIQYYSNDEFFFDLTDEVNFRMNNKRDFPINETNIGKQTHLEGKQKHKGPAIVFRHQEIYPTDVNKYWEENRFVYGAVILEEIRTFVLNATGFKASCGISSNPLLAKLACPLHKPGGITILTQTGLPRKSKSIKIDDIPGLKGGILGLKVKNMLYKDNVTCNMFELSRYSAQDLERKGFNPESTSTKVFNLANGISHDKVIEKLLKDRITVGKTFQQQNQLETQDFFGVSEHIKNLAGELIIDRLPEELEHHHRKAETIKFEVRYLNLKDGAKKPEGQSFQLTFDSVNDDVKQFTARVLEIFTTEFALMQGVIVEMSLSVNNFIQLQPF